MALDPGAEAGMTLIPMLRLGGLTLPAPIGRHQRGRHLGAAGDEDQSDDRGDVRRHQEKLIGRALDHVLQP